MRVKKITLVPKLFFYKNVGKEIDIKNEYNLIQEKKSNLSRSQREAVIAFYDIAKEHNLEI